MLITLLLLIFLFDRRSVIVEGASAESLRLHHALLGDMATLVEHFLLLFRWHLLLVELERCFRVDFRCRLLGRYSSSRISLMHIGHCTLTL